MAVSKCTAFPTKLSPKANNSGLSKPAFCHVAPHLNSNFLASPPAAIITRTTHPTRLFEAPNGHSGNNDFQNLFRTEEDVNHSKSIIRGIAPTTSAFFSAMSLAPLSAFAGPIGELDEASNTGIDPGFSTFGQWFFLLYIVVSLLAGGKEVLGRIQKQMDKDS